jgi:peptide/nickel transport system substrate-binding protein
MKLSRKIALVGAAAATIAMALSGCSASGGSKSSDGGTLTLAAVTAPTTFAADALQFGSTVWYAQAAYDTLLHLDPTTSQPVAWLATSWTYNDDKTQLTLKLRTDVTFSDGTKFDADAAAQNLIRFRDGSAPDKAQLAHVKDAKASDAETLVITLDSPDPSLLSNLTQAPGLMESPAAFSSSTLGTVPVGSGPFVMDTSATVAGSKYVFTKNPTYWAKDTVGFSKLVINVLSSPQAVLSAIQGRQIDATSLFDNTVVPQVTAAGFTAVPVQLNWAGLAIFDRDGSQTKALGDVRVRQAINYAIDRDAMLKAVGSGYGQVTSSIFSASSPAYVKDLDTYYTYDPAKAKSLLAEAGYANGFTVDMPRISGFGETADDLVAQYLKDVGITVNFSSITLTDAVGDILTPKYSMVYFELQQDLNPFQAANFLLTPDAAFNPYKTDDPKVVALVKTIQTGSDTEAATAAQELNTYTVEQAWNAPFYRTNTTLVLGPNVKTVQAADPETNGPAVTYLYNLAPKN